MKHIIIYVATCFVAVLIPLSIIIGFKPFHISHLEILGVGFAGALVLTIIPYIIVRWVYYTYRIHSMFMHVLMGIICGTTMPTILLFTKYGSIKTHDFEMNLKLGVMGIVCGLFCWWLEGVLYPEKKIDSLPMSNLKTSSSLRS